MWGIPMNAVRMHSRGFAVKSKKTARLHRVAPKRRAFLRNPDLFWGRRWGSKSFEDCRNAFEDFQQVRVRAEHYAVLRAMFR